MQVTHAADHISHAMIGGNKTIEFGISNDAAFFQILSSTLYSNQRLAVAREVLCNAWDAHIRAGKTDCPVIVDITEEKVSVRDAGAGIHPDMMGPLYGTYGGSDKKNNGTETGGFGLGCKSPFAYGDHFEVTSWHEGTKTIYNLSKSSADRFGKPGITPIISLPCGDETGLQVSIPLKERRDQNQFVSLFTEVARNGEMNVLINGQPVTGIPLSKAPHGWLITSINPLSSAHTVYVRYGNVIYPVDSHSAYASNYNRLVDYLRYLGSYGYRIIFQADPDTISVTPSRESLSMQEHTVKTLTKLLDKFFVPYFDRKIAELSETVLEQQIKKAVEQKAIGDLMQTGRRLIGQQSLKEQGKQENFISDLQTYALQSIRYNYPNDPSFYQKDMGLRIDGAILLGIGKRGHLSEIKRQLTLPKKKLVKKTTYNALGRKKQIFEQPFDWFKKTILRPLYRDLLADPALDHTRLHHISGGSEWSGDAYLNKPQDNSYGSYGDYLPLLRNVMVISYARKGLWEKIKKHERIVELGGADDIWFYHAPVSRTKIEKIREFFKNRGFHVVDFTEELVWEEHKKLTRKPIIAGPKKPRKTGYAALSGAIRSDKVARVDNCFLDDAPRIQKPDFYIEVTYSRTEFRELSLGKFHGNDAKRIVKLFGDKCAVVRTRPQADKLKESGLMNLNTYVVDYVCDKVTTSPSFLAYWPEDINRIQNKNGKLNDSVSVLSALLSIAEVRTELGLTTTLDEHDRMVLMLWRGMLENYHFRMEMINPTDSVFGKALKAVSAMSVSKAITDLSAKAKDNAFIELFDEKQLKAITRHPDAKKNGNLARLAKLTKTALLG